VLRVHSVEQQIGCLFYTFSIYPDEHARQQTELSMKRLVELQTAIENVKLCLNMHVWDAFTCPGLAAETMDDFQKKTEYSMVLIQIAALHLRETYAMNQEQKTEFYRKKDKEQQEKKIESAI
jgi:galactose-1-phosphate uridylyltransferase